MPIYVYEVLLPDGEEGQVFEVMQSMSDEPLTEHPTTGQPVRRVLQPAHIAGKWSESGSKQQLSDKNLEAHGFTKYVKAGGGYYEKRAGQGPDVISAGDEPG
ncbi:FmdB family zinc ribbon protein [Mucisphaera sp.]|uniref:FmdB family zinc ribbon protein n=1 Tax=Mucisphaera sp. TaxID=2913024 RepID=UPI003D11867A